MVNIEEAADVPTVIAQEAAAQSNPLSAPPAADLQSLEGADAVSGDSAGAGSGGAKHGADAAAASPQAKGKRLTLGPLRRVMTVLTMTS